MEPIETLEDRRLFAATPTFTLTATGTLLVTGTGSADNISVTLLHDKVADGFVGTIITKHVTYSYRGKFTAVKRISIDAGGGNDILFIGGGDTQTRPATLLGGAGNDTINYAATGPFYASGGSGNDLVGATAAIAVKSSKNSAVIAAVFNAPNLSGANLILGNAGNDTLSGDTNDQLDGGSGKDVAYIAVAASSALPAARLNALSQMYYQHLTVASVEVETAYNLLTKSS